MKYPAGIPSPQGMGSLHFLNEKEITMYVETSKSSLASYVSSEALFVTRTVSYDESEEVCEEVVQSGVYFLVIHIHRIGTWVSRTIIDAFSSMEDAQAFALDQVTF